MKRTFIGLEPTLSYDICVKIWDVARPLRRRPAPEWDASEARQRYFEFGLPLARVDSNLVRSGTFAVPDQ